ncbi:MAG: S-layer homology domain-containing protein [bacterium]
MKKFFTLTLAGLVLGIASIAFSATLVDVPSGHWAEDAVTKLINAGLIEGYPDGTFKGDRPMTRYEYAMVVERLMAKLDKSYCAKDECGAPGAPAAAVAGKCDCPAGAAGVDPAQLEEIKSIVKKLAAEFKDELAALKVKVDENSVKIADLENKVNNASIGKMQVKGSIRQRIDVPGTDLSNSDFANRYYKYMYNVTGVGTSGLNAGYEMVPTLIFSGNAGDNVTFSIGLDKFISNKATIGSKTTATELDIEHAYVDMDFASTVRELDSLKIRSGYQKAWFGPYGMLVDNTGLQSNPGVLVSASKDIVSVAAYGSLLQGDVLGAVPADGLGSTGKDVYAAARVGLDLSFVNLGVNYLASGLDKEKGWGADVVIPLLKNSPFLKQVNGEYLKITDLTNGNNPSTLNTAAHSVGDSSFVLGVDLYKNKKASLSLSYADAPAAPVLTSLDGSPFSEFDTACPLGLDVKGANCYSYESGRNMFPAGFEGLGVQASYLVFGDVELAGKAVMGNFAGGTAFDGSNLDGKKYPGFGAFSITKPINNDSKFRVEYMQQGKDTILLNRVRGELLINF